MLAEHGVVGLAVAGLRAPARRRQRGLVAEVVFVKIDAHVIGLARHAQPCGQQPRILLVHQRDHIVFVFVHLPVQRRDQHVTEGSVRLDRLRERMRLQRIFAHEQRQPPAARDVVVEIGFSAAAHVMPQRPLMIAYAGFQFAQQVLGLHAPARCGRLVERLAQADIQIEREHRRRKTRDNLLQIGNAEHGTLLAARLIVISIVSPNQLADVQPRSPPASSVPADLAADPLLMKCSTPPGTVRGILTRNDRMRLSSGDGSRCPPCSRRSTR